MKTVVIAILILNTILYSKIDAIVSIAPQKTFLQAIGGNKINITVMVKQGDSPHTYEPKPSQMKSITKADIYFSIGVEFEEIWLEKFQAQNSSMITIDSSKNIEKMKMKEYVKHKLKETKDPHVWTSPKNVKIIVQNMYQALIKLDKKNKNYYRINLNNFIMQIDRVDIKIKSILKSEKKEFIVFHPSWGYFAKTYNLVQIPIEIEGKITKPKDIKNIIDKAREKKIKKIFISPEFSDSLALQIAKSLKIPLIKLGPLNPKWSDNLINFAKQISKK